MRPRLRLSHAQDTTQTHARARKRRTEPHHEERVVDADVDLALGVITLAGLFLLLVTHLQLVLARYHCVLLEVIHLDFVRAPVRSCA